jgi:hypothetical protein
MLRRLGLSVTPRFLWECLTSRTVSPRHVKPSGRFSRTGLSCLLHATAYEPILLVGLSAPADEPGTR